jgi:hypothetical protein
VPSCYHAQIKRYPKTEEMNVREAVTSIKEFIEKKKQMAMLSVLLALMAMAGNVSAYTATYTSDDLGTAIVDLIVTFIVAVTGKAPTLAGLMIVLFTVAIIGAIMAALAAAAGVAAGIIKLKPKRG